MAWIRNYDDQPFDTYEEAYEAFIEDSDLFDDAFIENFGCCIDFFVLVHWVMEQESFWNDSEMVSAYDKAMKATFEENFIEELDED